MTTYTEARRTGEFIISEASGTRSREQVTVASGAGELIPGTVLGKITKGAVAVEAGEENSGDGVLTMDATTPTLANAKAGAYTATCIAAATNGGTFRVEDPDGHLIGDVAVGATFADGIKFVIADGEQDFAAGDVFTVTIAAGSDEYKPYDPEATDGAEVAAAVLYAAVDATSAAATAVVIARDAEVAASYLTGYDAGAKPALAANGIIVR
jgi:hypothetical protein